MFSYINYVYIYLTFKVKVPLFQVIKLKGEYMIWFLFSRSLYLNNNNNNNKIWVFRATKAQLLGVRTIIIIILIFIDKTTRI